MREYELLIDGKLVSPGPTFATTNPSASVPASLIARAGARDARRALDAARRAFDERRWSEASIEDRRRRLGTLADLLWERQAEIADVETAESGIPIRIASAIVSASIEQFRAVVAAPLEDAIPYGVVSMIPARDVPFARAAGALGVALQAGNTVVLSAGAASPGSVLELARACWEADLPAGVVNVLAGGADVDTELAQNSLADHIWYEGPADGARRIAGIVAPSLRPSTIRAGGPASAIVLGDADLDLAVPGVLFGAMILSGRSQAPLSRLLVPSAIAEPFVHHLARGATALQTGDPSSFATDLGPLAGEPALQAAGRSLRRALDDGAEAACGAQRAPIPGPFLLPTVLGKVTSEMRISHEELAAPVLSVIAYGDLDHAVAFANETFGDAAVWSRNVTAAASLARRLRARRVWVNDYDPLDSPEIALGRANLVKPSGRARSRQALIGLDSVYGFDATPYA